MNAPMQSRKGRVLGAGKNGIWDLSKKSLTIRILWSFHGHSPSYHCDAVFARISFSFDDLRLFVVQHQLDALEDFAVFRMFAA